MMGDQPHTGSLSMEAVDEADETNLVDLLPLCRMCARSCSEVEGTAVPVAPGSSLAKRMAHYLSIQMDQEGPYLPKQICKACSDSLDTWKCVRDTARQAHTFFRRQLELRRSSDPSFSEPPCFINLPKDEPEDLEVTCTVDVDPYSICSEGQDSDTELPPLECATCHEKFSNQHDFTFHQMQHREVVKPEVNKPSLRPRIKKKRGRKPGSGKKQPPRKKPVPKAKIVELEPAELPIPCGNCSLIFINMSEFENHAYSHSDLLTHKCGICETLIDTIPDLTQHVLEHKLPAEKSSTFTCVYCDKDFRSKTSMTSHMQYYHEKEFSDQKFNDDTTPYICGTCKKDFINLSEFAQHFPAEHNTGNELKCGICDAHFRKLSNLLKHEQEHRVKPGKNISFPCDHCGRMFGKQSLLSDHIRKRHSGVMKPKHAKKLDLSEFLKKDNSKSQIANPDGQTYLCGSCGVKFTNFQDFAKHFSTAHSTYYELPCGVCGAHFTKVLVLLHHERNHKTNVTKQISYICPYCHKGISAPRHLRAHIETVHAKDGLYPYAQHSSGSEPRTFQCDKCPESFTDLQKFNVHLSTHAAARCPLCYKMLENRAVLKKHLRGSHNIIETVERNTPCPICGKMFRSTTTLKVHMDLHSTSRNFVCEVCAKSYRTYSALYKHKKTHDKPKLQCDLCGRYVVFKSALKTHIMLHIGYLPFKCDHPGCNRAFTGPSMLNAHKLKKHNKEFGGHKCLKCHKPFKDIRNWRRHMLMICNIPLEQIPYTRDRQFIRYPKVSQPSLPVSNDMYYPEYMPHWT